MQNLITKISTLTFIIFLTSCGQVLNSTVESLADQAKSQIDSSGGFSQQELQGVWQSGQEYLHYDLPQVFEEGKFLAIDRFEKYSLDSLTQLEESYLGQCPELSSDDFLELESRYYLIFEGSTYKYVALSEVSTNNSTAKCWIEISSGDFEVLGSFVHLKQLELAFSFSPVSETSAEIGFAQN